MYWAVSRAVSGKQMASQGDPLFEGGARRLGQTLGQLFLAGEHDRQQLVRICFEIDEQTDLFEQFVRKGLRLVDDQRGDSARGVVLVEPDFELRQHGGLGFPRLGAQIEAARHHLNELVPRQGGIVHVQAPATGFRQRRERRAHERRLARPGRPEHGGHALALGDAVLQIGQRFLMLRRQKQVAWIRREVEGPLVQAKKALVHGQSSLTRT